MVGRVWSQNKKLLLSRKIIWHLLPKVLLCSTDFTLDSVMMLKYLGPKSWVKNTAHQPRQIYTNYFLLPGMIQSTACYVHRWEKQWECVTVDFTILLVIWSELHLAFLSKSFYNHLSTQLLWKHSIPFKILVLGGWQASNSFCRLSLSFLWGPILYRVLEQNTECTL